MKKIVLFAGGLLCTSSLIARQKPNIVLIVADDMRGTTMSFLGKEDVKTPVLDKFSDDCTVFTNAHIMGGTSGAVSMPSRAMLITGKYLYQLEEQGASIPEEHIMIGEVLNQAGYQTFHTGKWHNGKEAFNRCFNSGKDIFFGGMADHWNVPLFNYDPSGKYLNNRRIIKNPWANNSVELLDGEYSYAGKHSVDIFTETAVDFINEQKNKQKPFFLSLCYMSPHDPRSMPDEFLQIYHTEKILLPPNYMEEHPFDNGELAIRDEILAATPRVKPEVQRHIAEYYAMISHLDKRIGDVLAALKANGLYENTIVIFTADNGLAVGRHGLMGKQNVYEHSVNIPLLIKASGSDTKKTYTEQLCYLIDLFPSICEWSDQPIPESVDGISLLPIIRENKPIRNYLYYGYRDFQRGISDGKWKLIEYNVKGIKTTQLFNLEEDPYEINNLSTDKKYKKQIKALKDQLLSQRAITGDQSSFFNSEW
ncbi:MAG: sulfatase-like hydrolase/transferase [Prevotella sp.]|jgi:arylsulfatase A-like enzyme|nr:sulfatase-like hydrolase/transferase [Prevotella sp.]